MRKIIRDFLQLESASGMILLTAAFAGMILANSPYSYIYDSWTKSTQFLINEGLMSLFFMLVGLELKRGFLEGHFARASDVLLPLAAAAGGMLVPALIYLLFNYHHPEKAIGWSIPVATDIAFAVGVLSMFGNKIPRQLKLFLLSIALYDDLGAIGIIAFYYSSGLAVIYLLYIVVVITILLLLNAFRIRALIFYLCGGVLLWFLFFRAGIHPTMAGVVTAFLIPEKSEGKEMTPVHYLESMLHPWVAFIIMPVFALANTGLPLSQINMTMLFDSITMGIALGLFLGKQLGVTGVIWLSLRTTQWAKMPAGTSWLEFYGVALLCGIGFTMSLFLGTLSFYEQSHYFNEVRLGVIIGSVLSGIAGASVLSLAIKNRKSTI